MQASEKCPCNSDLSYQECCEPLLSEKAFAGSPLALMRSRFTAHVLDNIAHIERTMQGKALKLFDKEAAQNEWIHRYKWTKLEILDAPETKPSAIEGIVEFVAHYTIDEQPYKLHERSKFKKLKGKWFYVDGVRKNEAQNLLTSEKKASRNDPCPCGSGKKYKKCCG